MEDKRLDPATLKMLEKEAERQRSKEAPKRRRWTDVGDYDEEEEQILSELHFDR